jgi:Fic family protein
MSKVVLKYWVPDGAGLTRKDRRGCEYGVYIPDPLAGRAFTFDGAVAADVADAEAAIARLNVEASSLVSTEAIARLLLRAEAVASSKIEGLEVGARRLLRFEAARGLEAPGRQDVTAEEVLGSIDAMAAALEAADSDARITVDTILAIHRRLLAGTRFEVHGGRVRKEQNWVGGSAYNPCAAAFVPPPPEEVPPLLADLADFCNDDSLPAVAQAAIAHAQFETIHPFVNGNGRTGRALIQTVLRRRGLATRVVPPVSLVLATIAADYVAGLTAYRHLGDPGAPAAVAGLNDWVGLFAGACIRSTKDAAGFEARVRAIQRGWRERLGSVRRDSTVDLLIEALPGMPVLTVSAAGKLLGRSFPAANGAMQTLLDAGVVKQTTVGRRNRAFEAVEIIDAFTELERRLASPGGGTRLSPPARPVPARRTRS